MDIQKMRDARTKAVVVFTKFCQSKDRYDSDLFCFYEGEDIKYYESRVEEYTGKSYTNIVSFDCGGKNGVLKVRKLIKGKNVYDNVKKAFFVDKDYFATDIEDRELFETPCYSVESFYTSKTAFERLLKRGFGINVYEEDFTKCVNDFLSVQKQFHQYLIELNAWLKCQRKEEMKKGKRNIELSEFKVAKFFEKISIDEIKVKKYLDSETLYEIFPQAIKIGEKELAEEILLMEGCNQQQDFRGKFELEFLKKIVGDLRAKNKANSYFQEHRECVKLDPNVDTLMQFNQCADTPETLKVFLEQYKDVS